MVLAFYRVSNKRDYTRHTFDGMPYDEVMECLSKLDEDDALIYDTDNYGFGPVPSPNLADFEEDYNDEILDGGWWVVVLNKNNK